MCHKRNAISLLATLVFWQLCASASLKQASHREVVNDLDDIIVTKGLEDANNGKDNVDDVKPMHAADTIEAKDQNAQKKNDPFIFTVPLLTTAAITAGAKTAAVAAGTGAVSGAASYATQHLFRGWFGDEELDETNSVCQCMSITPIQKFNNSIKKVMETHKGKYVVAADFKGHQIKKNGAEIFPLEVVDCYVQPESKFNLKAGSRLALTLKSRECKCPIEQIEKGVYIMTGDYEKGTMHLDSDLVQLLHA